MREILLKLLFIAALCVPWVTQAQCNGTMCTVTISGTDAYGDGWNSASINVYQGTTLRGNFTISDGSSATATFLVCTDDSVRFEWNVGLYDEECEFTILNGDGSVIISDASGDSYDDGDVITTAEVVCPTCPAPTSLSIVEGTDNIVVTWVAGGDESSWLVSNGTEETVVSTEAYTFQNLTPNTDYTISVRAICAADDSSLAVTMPAHTLLSEAISDFPFICDFESADTNSVWAIDNGTLSNQWFIGAGANNTIGGDSSLFISSDNGSTNSYNVSSYTWVWAYTTFQFTAGQYAISFDWKAVGESCCDYLRAYIIPAASAVTPGTTLTTPAGAIQLGGNMNQQSTWQTATYAITIPTDGNYKLAFAWRNDGSIGTTPPAAVDNIIVDQLTCPQPTNLVVDSSTTESITISWTAGGTESEWLVSVNDSAFSVTNNPFTITDLLPSTPYTIGVAALCSSDDTSFTTTITGRTACGAISQLPYVMNFNDCPQGSSYEFDPCWAIYNNYNSSYNYPYASSGYLYTYLYSSSQNINSMFAYAMMPALSDDLATTDLELSFDIWASSSSYGAGVIVAAFDSVVAGMPTFDTIAVIIPTSTSQATAETYYVTIANLDLTGKRLGFLLQNQKPNITSAYDYYTYLDNVNLHEAPNCFVPGNLAVNAAQDDSVVVSWTDSVASSWQLAVGNQGFNPDTVSEYISVQETTYVFDQLPGGVTYEVYLRADCGDDQSMWIGPASFTPGAINMGVTGSATMYVCNAVIFDDGGATGDYATSCDYTLTLYPNDDTKRFKFWGSGSTESGYDYLRIYAGTAAAGTLLGSIQGSDITLDTVTTQGGPITLYFHSDGSVVYSGFELFVACEDLPACRDVENVSVVEVSTSSAYITWENTIGTTPLPNSYIVTVLDSTGAIASTVTTTDMYAILGGLDPNTNYTATVVPSCEDADGMASGTTFTTAGFGCLQVDATQAFSDTIGNGTGNSNYLPSYSLYNYGISQQIYTAAEIGHGGQIDQISFMMQTVAQQRTYEIYMGHVNVATATSYLNPADLTCVYNGGAVTMTANQWTTFNLTTPFVYNGTDNLLVVFRDMTGSYVSGNYGYVHSAPAGAAMYSYQDSGPYTPGTGSGYSLSVRNNIILAGAPCAVEATCAAPLVVLSNVTHASVDIMWAAGASETSWTVEHKAEGDATWTTDLTNTNTTSATVSNLLPDTRYMFRVYSMCGTDTFATVRVARTSCLGATVPFYENFSTWTASSSAPAPSCWFKGSDYSSTYPYVTTSYSMGPDANSMYFYASGTTTTYLALPKFDATIDTLVVSGNVYYSSNGYNLKIGYMTDPEDLTTFHPVSSVSTVGYTWQPFEVSFVGQPDGYIAFANGNDGSYSYLYLDNIEVNYLNPCIRPTNLNASNTTQTTATITWSDTAANDFVIEYGPAGFTHGNGTIVTSNADSVVLTGLNPGTMYNVYVRGVCGVGDTSNWSFVYAFPTECSAITSLPFFENFNSWGTGTSVHAPMCWTYGSDYSTTYPYIISTSHNTNGGSMYMYDGYTAGSTNKTWFALPELDSTVASVNQTQLLFYVYKSTDSYQSPVMVGVGENSTLDATVVWMDTILPTLSTWTEHEVPLDAYTGNGHYIFFATHIGGTDSYGYPYVDDITLEMIPSCPRPDNLTASGATANTVDLGWHERANAQNWIIEYGPMGFELGTGTTVAANSNPFTLTNLPAAYQGEFYVRSVCSNVDTGDYSRNACAFSTSQIPASIPYTYNFEDATEWANWQTSTNTTTNWYRGNAVADGGNYSLYISADSGATYSPYNYIETVNAAAFRDIDFGTVDTSFTINFSARVGGTLSAAYDGLMVFLVDPSLPTVASNSNITAPWGNVNDLYRIATVRLDTTWNTYSASFDTISGIHRVAFFWFNQNTGASYPNLDEPAAIDNISINYSSCPRPINLIANTGSTTATLSWQGDANANYEVTYRATDGGTNQVLYTPTNSITLTGLDIVTEYVYWVRKICSVGDTSLHSDGFVFNTDLCDGAINMYNYDPTASTTTSSYSPIGYATYNYSYVQTIIDSAYMADILAGVGGDITAFGFTPTNNTSSDYYTHMTVYMANVSESDLSSGFILPDSTNHVFVKVIDDADFSFTEVAEQIHLFDTVFTWDGHSNILFAVNREHGTWSSSTSFAAHTATSAKMRYIYQDSGPYNINTVSGGYTTNAVGDIHLISCGAGCPAPVVNVTNYDYQSATITWNGSATNYEVAIKAANETSWPTETAVSNAYTYTFTNLQPATQYMARVRQICDDEDISEWTIVNILTDSLPCFAPSNVEAEAQGQQAVISWTAGGNETEWTIHVFNTTFDQEYTATTNPYTVTGLTANVTYNVAVSANCGGGLVQSDWSDTISFTTVPCDPVTNVAAGNVTGTTAHITWTAGENNTNSWEVSWNYQGAGMTNLLGTATVNTASYDITGLTANTPYEVFVRAICAEGYNSDFATTTFTTQNVGIAHVEDGLNLSIFPNPATGNTTITLSGVNGNVTLSVVDMSGRTVQSTTMECSGDCEKSINVDNLAAGAYFVRVYGDNVNTVKKLIVK